MITSVAILGKHYSESIIQPYNCISDVRFVNFSLKTAFSK